MLQRLFNMLKPFLILQYLPCIILYDNKTLWYIEHTLYRLEKIKIAFEHHWLINAKLCQLTLNYPKFHATNHFIQCIRNYGSTINYNTAHNKAAHNYLLETFYNRTNKKEYNMQI